MKLQFRLRTLMIAVTLTAVACGWAVDHARLLHERDEAREAQQRAEVLHKHALVELQTVVDLANQWREELLKATEGKLPAAAPIKRMGTLR